MPDHGGPPAFPWLTETAKALVVDRLRPVPLELVDEAEAGRRRPRQDIGGQEQSAVARLPSGGSSPIQHATDLSNELRSREWLQDERDAAIDPRRMRGGLFRVA